jgi:predicted nucleic acid-binding protein
MSTTSWSARCARRITVDHGVTVPRSRVPALGPDLLVDTSAAVALVVEDHSHHRQTVNALGTFRLGLCGHAAFETFSVLTRLPPPARVTPAAVQQILDQNFPVTRFLGPAAATELLGELASRGVAGGMVFDALVGATAVEHRMTLASRDRRALDTYRSLNVQVHLID